MNNLETIRSKICTLDQIRNRCNLWRDEGKKIVFSNGCFDLLHLGHLEYLAKARECGDILVIGMNSDTSVQRLKGKGRPVNDQQTRSMFLASLSFVDAVVLFEEDTPRHLIQALMPDILVKGNDYTIDQIAGSDLVAANGGKTLTIELTEGYSTTGLIERIKAL
jgi:D-glycero-beta-D-manno-heptose 1-phosphate adenylyltransferase